MGTNLLVNGGFEGGTSRATNRWKVGASAPDHPVLPEVEVPAGWVMWWHDGYPGPGAADQTTGQPEVKVVVLPWFQDAKRIRSGNKAVLAFTFWRNHDCGLQQSVSCTRGNRYRFSIFAHSWHSDCDSKPYDPPLAKNCVDPLPESHDWVSVGIDPDGGIDPFGPSVIWSTEREAYGKYPQEPVSVEAVATGATMTVFTRARTIWALKHGDTYYDDAALEVIGEPEPEPVPGRGVPRLQYARRYNVIPGVATEEQAVEVFRQGWQRGRETTGGSYDDAGIGDLDDRTAVLYGIEEPDQQTMLDWYAKWYPEVEVAFEPLPGDEPEPPGPPPVVPDRHARFGVASAHVQAWDGGALLNTYLPAVVPAVFKVFSLEDVRGVLAATNCQTRVVVRMARACPEDPVTGPAEWIGYWGDGLRSTYAKLQQEFGERLLPGSVLFEEGNEWVGGDYATNMKRRDWSLQFCEDLPRLAPGWAPACFCVAVGNPPEEQVREWSPVADAVEFYLGAMGYHAYWIANTDWERDWPWLQGRWAQQAAVWAADGYRPWLYCGESGVIEGYFYPDATAAAAAALDVDHLPALPWMADAGDPYGAIRGRFHELREVRVEAGQGLSAAATASGSYWLNSGDDAGWRVKAYNGDWSKYQRDWAEMIRRCVEFGPQQLGPCGYTVGPAYVHWESFKMRDPQWESLRSVMEAYPLG